MKNDATFFGTAERTTIHNDFATKALHAIGEIPELIVSSGLNSDYCIDEILSRAGALFQASRAYVMLDEKDGKYLRNTHEWVNDSIGPAMFSWPLYDYEYDIPSLKTIIAESDIFYGNTINMPQDLNNVLTKQGVISIIMAPLIRDRVRFGLLGLDFCAHGQEFTIQHANTLKHIAGLLSITLERKQFQVIRNKLHTIRDCVHTLEPYIETANDEEIDDISSPVTTRPTTLSDAVRRIIVETLELYNGNKLKAAKHLGLTWPSLDRRCKKLGIEARRK